MHPPPFNIWDPVSHFDLCRKTPFIKQADSGFICIKPSFRLVPLISNLLLNWWVALRKRDKAHHIFEDILRPLLWQLQSVSFFLHLTHSPVGTPSSLDPGKVTDVFPKHGFSANLQRQHFAPGFAFHHFNFLHHFMDKDLLSHMHTISSILTLAVACPTFHVCR